jgi:hypothetical protein
MHNRENHNAMHALRIDVTTFTMDVTCTNLVVA